MAVAICPNVWNADLMAGSVQSAAGQPLADPLSNPMAQGFLPAFTIWKKLVSQPRQATGST